MYTFTRDDYSRRDKAEEYCYNAKEKLAEPSDELLAELIAEMNGVIIEEVELVGSSDKKLLTEYDIIEEPESRVKDFPVMETLAIVGIKGERQVCPIFHPEIGLLTGLGEFDNLYYNQERIENVRVPRIGAEKITSRILTNSIVVDADRVYGDLRNDNYILGIQEKIDGFSACVFQIVLYSGLVISFYWDDTCIIRLEKNIIPCLFERVDDILYVIGIQRCRIVEENIVVKGVAYKIREKEYEYLTQEAIDHYKEKEGAIININGMDYKCPNKRVITLYSDGLHITDKQGRWREYVEKGAILKEKYVGCVDFEYNGNRLFFSRYRLDKEVCDSGAAIEQIFKNMIVLGELERYLVIPKKRKKNALHSMIEVLQVDTIEEKFRVMNAKMRESKVALVFVRSRNSSSRDEDIIRSMGNKYSVEAFTMNEPCFYYLGGMARYKYKPRKEFNWSKGRIKFSNIWKDGYKRLCVRRLDVFGECCTHDIPGLGLVGIVYVLRS